MKRSLKTLAGLVGGAMLSASASAYDNVYFFGDSLSDSGQFTFLSPDLQALGLELKFTNFGPQGNIIAADVVAAAYGFASVDSGLVEGLYAGQLVDNGNNYAVGGAVAIDTDGNELTPDFNLPTQINSHLLSRGGAAESGALYNIIIGGNDLFDVQEIRASLNPEASGPEQAAIRQASKERVDQAVDSVKAQLLKLAGSGAQNIVIGNAPDVSRVPATDYLVAGLLAQAQTEKQTRAAQQMYEATASLVDRFNSKLADAVAEVEAVTGIDIIEYDLEAFLNAQIDNADELGYTNATDACDTGTPSFKPCTGYIFADAVHPTTDVHQKSGFAILQLLSAQ